MIEEIQKDYSRVIGEQEYSQIWRAQSKPITIIQTKRLSENEVILDYRFRERLEKEFLRDYDTTIDPDLASSRIREIVTLYQNMLEHIEHERTRTWSGGSLGDIIGQLHKPTSSKQIGPKDLTEFDSTILGVMSFYFNTSISLPKIGDYYNFLWNNWDFGDVTQPGTKDSVTKRSDFFQELLFRQGQPHKDPHFITEILLESAILPNRRPMDTNLIRTPHNSRQHIYLSKDATQSITVTNFGQRSFNKISEVTGGMVFEYTVAIKPGGYDFYQFPGNTFNWTNLEIDYYQLYLDAPKYGIEKPVFYHFGTKKVLPLEVFEKVFNESGYKTYVYPKGKIEIPRSGSINIDALIANNRLSLFDFLYFGEAQIERGRLSRRLLEQRGEAKWTEKSGVKFLCDNLLDIKRVMRLFGQHPSELVQFAATNGEIVKFDPYLWEQVREQLSNKVQKCLKTRKLTTKPTFLPTINANKIFRYFDHQNFKYYQNLPCQIEALNNLQRKVILENTQDNGERLYRDNETDAYDSIQCITYRSQESKSLQKLVKGNLTEYNGFRRLNNSRSARSIMPNKSENLVEFDRFPGFDKKSVLKFSGINLIAKWERNQARRYRNESVKYETEYLPYLFIDSLVKEFLERKIHTKLVLEQINLYRWDTYHELKTLPFDTISWQCLQKVLNIPDLRKCPPIVIYFYYLLFYLMTITTTVFRRLYQNLVRRRIAIDIGEIVEYLTSKPDEITLKSHQVLPIRVDDLVKKILLDYKVKSTERKKIIVSNGVEVEVYVDNVNVNFSGPNNFKTSGPIYLDEQRTETIYLRSDSLNYPFNIGSIFTTGLPICFHNVSNNQIVSDRINSSRFEEPKKSSKSGTKPSRIDKYQETNNIIYHWLRHLVLDKMGSENVVFGTHYSRVTSSVFNDFLGKSRSFLTQQDILLMIGSFYYIFFNSHNLRVLPIYWGHYSVNRGHNTIVTSSLLNITPLGVDCTRHQIVDGSKYQMFISEVVVKLLNMGDVKTVTQIDKRIGPLPKTVNVKDITTDKTEQFNLAFQKVFYRSLENPNSDKKLVETELMSVLKNEQLEPRGTFCPKMYDFNRWQDYQIWVKRKEIDSTKTSISMRVVVAEPLTQFFNQFITFNQIFDSSVQFHNPSKESLKEIGQVLGEVIDPSYPDLKLETIACHRNTHTGKTQNPSHIGDTQRIQEISRWLLENEYLNYENLVNGDTIQFRSHIHQHFYKQLSTNEENRVENRPRFIYNLRGEFIENDRGFNFKQTFNYDQISDQTTYDIGSARVKLAKSTTIFRDGVNITSEMEQICTNDWEIYGRLIRYFKHWLNSVPFMLGQIPILRDSRRVLKQLLTISKSSKDPALFADYFLRVLIVSVIPTESQITDDTLRSKIRDELTPFSFYIKTMERESNHFLLSKYQERRQLEEIQRLNKLRNDSSLNKQMRLAPKHIKSEELVRELTGTGEDKTSR